MTFSAACENPMHRLFALVGPDRIDQEMATTDWPNLATAVAYLVLEEHGPDDWRRAAELMVEAGFPAAVLEELDPEQFWVTVMAMMTGMDPATGEFTGPPVRDRPPRARPHGPRRGPFRRR